MDGKVTEPPVVHTATVPAEWIDYNGHMTEGFYGVVFADAGDALLLELGFDGAYRDEQRGSFYTAETHIRFLRELDEGAPLAVSTQVLGVDPKRLHLFHVLNQTRDDFAAATQETMLLHVDLDTGRVRPMAGSLLARMADVAAEHAGLPVPDAAGRAIRRLEAS